jgi:hypothetical protein
MKGIPDWCQLRLNRYDPSAKGSPTSELLTQTIILKILKQLEKIFFCNISIEFSKPYCHCFNKPYFLPNFSDETTSVAY